MLKLSLFRLLRSKTVILNVILAILLISMLNYLLANPKTYSYYNKKLVLLSKDILSNNTTNLIILIVSGDKNYQTPFLKNLFIKNQIIHLLVLSGSNLVIFILLLTALSSKEHLSYFLVKTLTFITYFTFTGLTHPLARAVIFTIYNDIIDDSGIQKAPVRHFMILLLLAILLAIYLDFSLSFILSAYFSLAIHLFNIFKIPESKVLKIFFFNFYMTVVTIFSGSLFGFKVEFDKTLFMNLAVIPFFDIFVLIAYLSYLLLPLITLHPLLSPITDLLESIFVFLVSYLVFWSNTL